MKALSLIQPWGTLIALGEKKIETRSWKTNYRGPILIHAGKKIDKEVCKSYPFYDILMPLNYHNGNLPTGLIIAKCDLIDCLKIENPIYEGGIFKPKLSNGETVMIHNEFYFGDYSPGRFAWMLDNIEILKEPIPAKGQLGLWNFEWRD